MRKPTQRQPPLEPESRFTRSWTNQNIRTVRPRIIGTATTSPPATKVTFAIEAAGPKNVKLTVMHETYEPGSSVDGRFMAGWPPILSSLKTLLETGEALDVTKRWEQSESAQK